MCKLKKEFYCLKHAPRAWYERIDNFLTKLGYSKNEVNPNLCFKIDGNEMIILVLHVDDLLLTSQEHLKKK